MIFIFFFSKCTDLAPHSLNYHNLLTILNWKGPFGTSKAPRTIHILIQSLGPVALWSRVRYYNTSKTVVHAHLPLRHPKSRLGFVCNNIVRFRPFVRSFRLPLMWFCFVRFFEQTLFLPILFRSKMHRLFLVLCLCYGLPGYASSEETTTSVYEHCGNLQLQENIQIKLVRIFI